MGELGRGKRRAVPDAILHGNDLSVFVGTIS